jgi:leucyl-tRNA synthetase
MKSGKYIAGRNRKKCRNPSTNVVTRMIFVTEYGADNSCVCTNVLGPLTSETFEYSWNFGCFWFLEKTMSVCILMRMALIVTTDAPTKDNLKSLHKTIKG